jgi:PadR family transcriptional regulator PadR
VDIQLKRGLLDVCVLAAIKEKASYGYQIMKDMRPLMELSESTLYTILKRLEQAEMLTVETVDHGGRLRKYYQITSRGRARIREFLSEWQEIAMIYQFVAGGEEQNGKTSIS